MIMKLLEVYVPQINDKMRHHINNRIDYTYTYLVLMKY